MKFIVLFAVLLVSGYFAYQQMHPAPPPPPPPPPPALDAQTMPVISPAEQNKIVRATEDPDPKVRWEALVLLDKMRVPNAYTVIFEKLQKDVDSDLRLKIINLLATRNGAAGVAQNLVWATQDREPAVRIAALRALDRLGDYTTASAITDSLHDQDDAVRLQALKTLNSLQDKKQAALEAERRHQEELQKQAAAAASQGR